MEQVAALSTPESVSWIVVGIAFSLALPVAVKTLKQARTTLGLESLESNQSPRGKIAVAWERYGGTKYLLIAIAALVVAAGIVLLLGLTFYKVRDAVMAGFAWESFISKLADQQKAAANQILNPQPAPTVPPKPPEKKP